MTLRCGRIKYTNDLPIYAAFDFGALEYPGSLRADTPASLNAMLLSGELDMSPISAFTWAANAQDLVLLPDLCIGARDEVVSVVLVSPVAPAMLDATPIFVTQESASGRYLLRVILERRYRVRPRYVDEALPLERALRGDATLLIGDSAIDALERFPSAVVYDLGKTLARVDRPADRFRRMVRAPRRLRTRSSRRARLHARAHRCLYLVALAH